MPLDTSEFDAFSAKCREIGRKGVVATPDGQRALKRTNANQVLTRGINLVKREAVATAPRSAETGISVWSKDGHRYEGLHGDLRKQRNYTSRKFKRSLGFVVSAGGKKDSRQKLAGLVSKFAGFDVRRRPGGGASKGTPRIWTQRAADKVAPVIAKGVVSAYVEATEIVLSEAIKQKSRRQAVALETEGAPL